MTLTYNNNPLNSAEASLEVISVGGVPVSSQISLRTLSFVRRIAQLSQYTASAVYSTVPQSVVTDALQNTGQLYERAMQAIFYTNTDLPGAYGIHTHTISKDYYQPYTAASCVQEIIQGPSDETSVFFPLPPGSLEYQRSFNAIVNFTAFPHENIPYQPISGIEHEGANRSELFRAPGNTSEYRLLWFELPQDRFNGSAIGAIALLPRAPNLSS